MFFAKLLKITRINTIIFYMLELKDNRKILGKECYIQK